MGKSYKNKGARDIALRMTNKMTLSGECAAREMTHFPIFYETA